MYRRNSRYIYIHVHICLWNLDLEIFKAEKLAIQKLPAVPTFEEEVFFSFLFFFFFLTRESHVGGPLKYPDVGQGIFFAEMGKH